jgi:hypothetical protein
VAAADSLCAVAGGGKCRKFPRGFGPDGGPDDGPGGPQGGGSRPGDPLWVRAWGGFASVMFTTIGAVAALVGWVGGLFKSRPRVTAQASAVRPEPSGARSAVVDRVPRPAVREVEPQAAPAAAASGPPPVAGGAEGQEVAAPDVVEARETMQAAVAPARPKAERKTSAKKTTAKKAAAKKTAAKPAQTARRSNAKRVTVTRADVPKTEPTPPPQSEGSVAQGPAKTAKAAPRKVPPAPKPAVAASRKKGSGRRGIQLKSLGKTGGNGLN